MRFLIQTRISVQMLKLFKNSFGDAGMQSIGEFISSQAAEPVQEIHLSHNQITWRGALAVFGAVKDCGLYPCNRGKDGTPLWLRMENNLIDWNNVISKLDEWKMHMSIGDNRDSWKSDVRRGKGGCKGGGKGDEAAECPLVAMHYSYHHQTVRDKGHGRGDGYEGWDEDEYGDWDAGEGYDHGHRGDRRRDRDRGERDRDRDRERDRHDRDRHERDRHERDRLERDRVERDRHERDRDRGGAAAAPRAEGSRRDRDRDRGSAPGGGERADWHGQEEEHREVAAMHQYMDKKLQTYMQQQEKKFKLIFDLLQELKDNTTTLEQSIQPALSSMHQPAPQQFAVQMMQVPVDGGGQPQNWGGKPVGSNVVW